MRAGEVALLSSLDNHRLVPKQPGAPSVVNLRQFSIIHAISIVPFEYYSGLLMFDSAKASDTCVPAHARGSPWRLPKADIKNGGRQVESGTILPAEFSNDKSCDFYVKINRRARCA